MKPVIERWWSFVKKTDYCWLWTGHKSTSGYGRLSRNGQLEHAHRVAWELFRGPIPQGMYVLHKCDNRICVNPEHLFIGTPGDNMQDMWNKGRHPKPQGWRGEAHPKAKLSNADIHFIRSFVPRQRGDWKSLAQRLGVDGATVRRARNRVSWIHI